MEAHGALERERERDVVMVVLDLNQMKKESQAKRKDLLYLASIVAGLDTHNRSWGKTTYKAKGM